MEKTYSYSLFDTYGEKRGHLLYAIAFLLGLCAFGWLGTHYIGNSKSYGIYVAVTCWAAFLAPVMLVWPAIPSAIPRWGPRDIMARMLQLFVMGSALAYGGRTGWIWWQLS